MSKLVSKTKVVVLRDEFQELVSFKKKHRNFTRYSIDVEGETPDGVVVGYSLDRKNGEYTTKFSFKYKDGYYSLNEDGSIRFNINAENLEQLQNETERVKEAVSILEQINVNDYSDEVEKSLAMFRILDWLPYTTNFEKLFEYFGGDSLDKHEICKKLWSMKKDDLDYVIDDFYHQTKKDGIQMYGRWFDDLEVKIELVKEFNQKYN